MGKINDFKNLLIEAGIFYPGPTKGSFILPENGYRLWENIRTVLDKRFLEKGVKNVLLPSLIPLSLMKKEKQHIEGFNPECFFIKKKDGEENSEPLILRPTSEVLFCDWYSKILKNYRQLPLLYNQWTNVFRLEKNTTPFLRNTEFFWQEGHTIHSTSEEAEKFTLTIFDDYKDYARRDLCLAVISGLKTEGEKFAGALSSYSVECLMLDGQCLQLATSHFFSDIFCRLFNIKFQTKENNFAWGFSTSWGTSTRAIGALANTHYDKWGLLFPFNLAPLQVALVILEEENSELKDYADSILVILKAKYRCKVFTGSNFSQKVLKIDKEGCPLKIIIGFKEKQNEEINLVWRNNIENNHQLKLTERIFDWIEEKSRIFDEELYNKSLSNLNENIEEVFEFQVLLEKLKKDKKGLYLVNFCNQINCEKEAKNHISNYSFRCLKELNEFVFCLFCKTKTKFAVYLGRSY